MASDLRPAELFKRTGRVDKFIEKYEKNDDFLTTDNKKVKLKKQKHVLNLIKEARRYLESSDSYTQIPNNVRNELNNLVLVSNTGPIHLKNLSKTYEFGGTGGAYSAPSAEAVHGFLYRMHHLDKTYKLNIPTRTEMGELEVLMYVNKYILDIEGPIDIKIGNKILKNVYGFNKVSGTPKADISVVTFNESKKSFEEIFYISHKKGSRANDYNQYSGVSPGAGSNIYNHPEVKEFLGLLTKFYDEIVKDTKRYYMPIKDEKLIQYALYGPKFTVGGIKNEDNIDMIAQGNPSIMKSGKFYTLTFSAGSTSFSPDIGHYKSGDYQAVIGARYTSDRGFVYGGKRYNDVRVLIFPVKTLGSEAKNIKEL